MLNDIPRTTLIGGWLATLAVTAAVGLAFGATLTTTALLLTVGVAAAIAISSLVQGTQKQTVAEIIHTAETNGRR